MSTKATTVAQIAESLQETLLDKFVHRASLRWREDIELGAGSRNL